MTVTLTMPDLWEACRREAVDKIGSFNNRAMQQAIVWYRERGGEYVPKTPAQLAEERPSNIRSKRRKDE
jgi:hypothetical protein